MDLNRFFHVLNDESLKNQMENDIENFKSSPYYKLGMFNKLILNGLGFKRQVVSFFEKSIPEVDKIELAGEFMIYNRAWFWISQFDWSDENWVEDLKKIEDEYFLTSIKLSISYFEENEDYEKCAFLKKIQDFIEESLA
jgi:hypothetical protein